MLCLSVWGLGRVLHVLSPVLWPLAVAGVIAYLLDPVVDFFEHRKVPRTRAIVFVFAMALLLFLGIAGSVIPQVVLETRQLVSRIPTYTNRVRTSIEGWMTRPPAQVRSLLHWRDPHGGTALLAPDQTNAPSSLPAGGSPEPSTNAGPANAAREAVPFWEEALASDAVQSVTAWLSRIVPQVGLWLFGQVTKVASWFGVLAGLALVPVYAFYFLLEKQGIQSRWTDYLPVSNSAFKDELVFVLRSINDYLITFFRGQVLVAVCDGVLYTIGFILIGLPYAVLIGVMATFLTIIPFLGAIVTCVAALVVAFVQFGDLLHPFLVLVVFAVVQSLEGLVISPKIMGDRVGLHPLTIIIAVMAGTTLLGGILGGVLAIPLTAALRVLMFRYVWRTPE
jgi:predicted PurR-regulated permease PerM